MNELHTHTLEAVSTFWWVFQFRSTGMSKQNCHQTLVSGTDSRDKRVQKDDPPHEALAVLSQHFLMLSSQYRARPELCAATVMLQKPSISWRRAGSTRAASDLSNESHSSSSYVYLKTNKRETGSCPEINTLCFVNYWKSLTAIN